MRQLAKKRYMGMKFVGKGDAGEMMCKGVEIVRRDGCPALVKVFKEAVRIMFTTGDVGRMKGFLEDNWRKIEQNYVNLLDLVFSREVRLGHYKQMPAAGYAALRRLKVDPHMETQYGERVKYLIVSNHERSKLRDMCVPIEEYMSRCPFTINTQYYITNVINKPLNRFTQTFNVDVNKWYLNLYNNSDKTSREVMNTVGYSQIFKPEMDVEENKENVSEEVMGDLEMKNSGEGLFGQVFKGVGNKDEDSEESDDVLANLEVFSEKSKSSLFSRSNSTATIMGGFQSIKKFGDSKVCLSCFKYLKVNDTNSDEDLCEICMKDLKMSRLKMLDKRCEFIERSNVLNERCLECQGFKVNNNRIFGGSIYSNDSQIDFDVNIYSKYKNFNNSKRNEIRNVKASKCLNYDCETLYSKKRADANKELIVPKIEKCLIKLAGLIDEW